ncbi:hypothetical protein ACIA58_26380 [Kribbella sp. NPDC051586]|uniref:hypothetical protein n=1 Tax=Kribbella sp. NPDC051586 TaxID=3364118 RepID=UPI003799C6D8
MTTEARTVPSPKKAAQDYGPVQASRRLGIARWQFRDALRLGLIPAATLGRWPAEVIEDVERRLPEILSALERPGVFFVDEDRDGDENPDEVAGVGERSIVDSVFGRSVAGQAFSPLPGQTDIDSALRLTSPVLPPLYPDLPRDVEDAREILQNNAVDLDRFEPAMPEEIHLLQLNVREGLYRYLAHTWRGDDRLYVLEFQGPWQYVMFGHTKDLARRVTKHMNDATRHGFALLNAWASPPFADARAAERSVLLFARQMHRFSRHESFPQLPYPKALSIARAVFELQSGWPDEAVPATSPVTYPDQRSAELARMVRNVRRLGPDRANGALHDL